MLHYWTKVCRQEEDFVTIFWRPEHYAAHGRLTTTSCYDATDNL